MCFTQTVFYHSCKHYGANPIFVHRCACAEHVHSHGKGCDYTESLGVVPQYGWCPCCATANMISTRCSSPVQSVRTPSTTDRRERTQSWGLHTKTLASQDIAVQCASSSRDSSPSARSIGSPRASRSAASSRDSSPSARSVASSDTTWSSQTTVSTASSSLHEKPATFDCQSFNNLVKRHAATFAEQPIDAQWRTLKRK